MALLRKKTASNSRRRPRPAAQDRQSFSYGARTDQRVDAATNTGRQTGQGRGQAKRPSTDSLKRFWLQRFGMIILITAILVCVVSALTLTPNAKIEPLKATDGSAFLRDQATYQAAADKLLASSVWNRNKITIDTEKFSAQMVKQFPELSGVSVELPLLAHRPVVYLQPAQPALILATDSGSYVIDERGRALLPADGSPTQTKLPQVVDQSGLRVRLNQQALSSDDVRFIQTVIRQLAAKQFTVSSLVLPASSSELDARLAGKSYFIKFNLQDDNPRQQAGTFLATIANLQRKNTLPTKYVDVRVPGRAYYQ